MERKQLLAYARQRLGLEVLPCSSDRNDLVTLTRTIYPTLDIGDPRYLAWQYDQNPAGPAICRVARSGGKTVGAFTIIPLRVRFQGRSTLAGLSINTMTHPEYRGQGVFPILGNEVLQALDARIEFVLGFPNPFSFKGFLRDLEFQTIGQLPLWVSPLDFKALSGADRFASNPFLRGLLTMGAPAARLLRRGLAGRRVPKDLQIEEVTQADSRFDTLWKQASRDHPCAVERDAAYLTWRFIRHPTRRYRLFAAQRNGALCGYIVTRQDRILDLSSGLIVDLLVEKNAQGRQAARALVQHVTRIFEEQRVALAACLMPRGTPGARALRGCLYLPCPPRWLPQPFPITFRWARPAQPAPPSGNAWYLTMGDYDAV